MRSDSTAIRSATALTSKRAVAATAIREGEALRPPALTAHRTANRMARRTVRRAATVEDRWALSNRTKRR